MGIPEFGHDESATMIRVFGVGIDVECCSICR